MRTTQPARLTELLQHAGATVRTGPDGELVIRGLGTADIGDRACAAGIGLHELTPQAGSLEELFLDWTSNDHTHPGSQDTAEVAATERQAVPQ